MWEQEAGKGVNRRHGWGVSTGQTLCGCLWLLHTENQLMKEILGPSGKLESQIEALRTEAVLPALPAIYKLFPGRSVLGRRARPFDTAGGACQKLLLVQVILD